MLISQSQYPNLSVNFTEDAGSIRLSGSLTRHWHNQLWQSLQEGSWKVRLGVWGYINPTGINKVYCYCYLGAWERHNGNSCVRMYTKNQFSEYQTE